VAVLGNKGNLSRTGYKFAGWNTSENGSGTTYAPSDIFAMGGSDMILYAKWTAMSAYEVWAESKGFGSGDNIAFNSDADGDGLANGLAWLLDGNQPMANTSSSPHQIEQDNGNISVSFKMLNSANRGSASLIMQYSTDLGAQDPWSSHSITVPDVSSTVGGVSFVITPMPGTNYNHVEAAVPASVNEGSGNLFVRFGGVLTE
jgi:uncharacterized repeat protein (TIGR02543 family)